MAKIKEKTREQKYGEILGAQGISLEDCVVLSFVFGRDGLARIFHYSLMSERAEYCLFDAWDNRAKVVVKKGGEERIIKIAGETGGELI